MSDLRIVRGLNSRRMLLQLDDHNFIVLRKGDLGSSRVGSRFHLYEPMIEPWDGDKLTDEESVMVAKYALSWENE